MDLGSFGRGAFGNCDFAQSRRRVARFALRICSSLARDRFGRDCVYFGNFECSVRFPKGPDLGFVRPSHAALAAERSLLVVIRGRLAEPASAKFSLLPDSNCLCDRDFASLHSELETRNALGTRHGNRAQPGFASVVLHLDFALRRLAERVRLERPLGHTLRLLFVLGRTPLRAAVAC